MRYEYKKKSEKIIKQRQKRLKDRTARGQMVRGKLHELKQNAIYSKLSCTKIYTSLEIKLLDLST